MKYFESTHAKRLLNGLKGLEIGGAAHNPFYLDTLNVDHLDYPENSSKVAEMEICGEVMKVDILAHACRIPVADKSFDFVISSHVIEHIYNPIEALKEWERIARKYIYIICPKRNALPSDVSRELTTLDEIIERQGSNYLDYKGDDHYSRWTPDSFRAMCHHFGFDVVEVLDTDDKVGNGFTIVIKCAEE